ncbi:MAG: glycoside hydrolase family 15 protein, partial [Proteobacteria bacterium]|nr:glycoside hydrolase family 15 protein [Pseudomonadota bacterium]
MSKRIEDYAMIGDGETVALVGRNGSIDWLCWSRFDSDACFAALLGDKEHGCWSMTTEDPHPQMSRSYCGNTLVLETVFATATGKARLIDFMPVRSGSSSSIIRIVTGLEGNVALQSDIRLRFGYGTVAPWFITKKGAITGKVGPDLVIARSDVPIEIVDGTISAHFEVREGQRVVFTLQHGSSTEAAPAPLDADRLLDETKTWWLEWIERFDKPAEWPDFVRRSLITMKALTYFPTGGMVAAATTSLPEKPGGRMNWDYRYCWLRDSTFTLTAFLNAGLKQEAHSWFHWLLRAVAGSPDKIRIAYKVDGGRRLEEWTPSWLPGFNGARPVRVGNGAAGQRQLDIFGEILDSSHIAERAGLERNEWEIEIERRLVMHVAEVWREPD